mgnify:CR=1 FL=1
MIEDPASVVMRGAAGTEGCLVVGRRSVGDIAIDRSVLVMSVRIGHRTGSRLRLNGVQQSGLLLDGLRYVTLCGRHLLEERPMGVHHRQHKVCADEPQDGRRQHQAEAIPLDHSQGSLVYVHAAHDPPFMLYCHAASFRRLAALDSHH